MFVWWIRDVFLIDFVCICDPFCSFLFLSVSISCDPLQSEYPQFPKAQGECFTVCLFPGLGAYLHLILNIFIISHFSHLSKRTAGKWKHCSQKAFLIQFLAIFIWTLIKYHQCLNNSWAVFCSRSLSFNSGIFPSFFAVQLGVSCYVFTPCWVSLSCADPSWSHTADSLW